MGHATPQRTAYDLAVVGAGAVGLASAWRAARAGMSVVVLERDRAGAGASGVAAGMLAPVTEVDFGEEELLALNIEGRALWGEFAALLQERSGVSTGYSDSGCLVVAADRDDAVQLRRLHGFQQQLGLDAEWLTPRAARALEPGLSPRVGGAISTPDDGHVDPAAVVAALERAFEVEGGELITDAEVAELIEDGGRAAGVRTTDGLEIHASAVLVAAGAWSAAAGLASLPGVPAVRPVKGQLLELRVREGRVAPLQRVVRTPRCYVVPRPDGRVVVGATTEEQGFDLTVTADGVFRLLEAAIEVLPDIAELELERTRAGLRPGTPDGRPVIAAAGPPGLLWATGHGRNGVLLAPLTAERVVDLLGAPTSTAPTREERSVTGGHASTAPTSSGSRA